MFSTPSREDLKTSVIEALEAHNGSASIVLISKYIWDKYEPELLSSDDLFYTWQDDLRWAGNKLQKKDLLRPKPKRSLGPWRLARV